MVAEQFSSNFHQYRLGYQAALEDAQSDINKIKAEAVREAIKSCYAEGRLRNDTMSSFCFVRDLTLYADQLEEN